MNTPKLIRFNGAIYRIANDSSNVEQAVKDLQAISDAIDRDIQKVWKRGIRDTPRLDADSMEAAQHLSVAKKGRLTPEAEHFIAWGKDFYKL